MSGCLQRFTPRADELDGHTQYIVDGTLVPCWSWRGRPELYSGKHKRTGYNLQVVCDMDRQLAWISDLVDGMDPTEWFSDKGYIGEGMHTPIKKPERRNFLDWVHEFNSSINKIRWVIEQAIANLKHGGSYTPTIADR